MSAFEGMKWKAIINGKRAANGAQYSATHSGDVPECADGLSIYDILRELACHLEEANAEMEFPDSMRITLIPPLCASASLRENSAL
jgi:hypothetical protein